MRRWTVLLTAFALVAVGCGGDEGEAAPETPSDVAMALIDTWNEGDVPGFFAWFADGATIDGYATDYKGMYSDLGFYMGLGQTVTVDECSAVGETGALCTAMATDELSGPLGVETPITWKIEAADGQVTSLEWAIPAASSPDVFEVADAAAHWLLDAHADVFDETFKPTLCFSDPHPYNLWDGWCSSPEAAAELLRFGDEFRAAYGS